MYVVCTRKDNNVINTTRFAGQSLFDTWEEAFKVAGRLQSRLTIKMVKVRNKRGEPAVMVERWVPTYPEGLDARQANDTDIDRLSFEAKPAKCDRCSEKLNFKSTDSWGAITEVSAGARLVIHVSCRLPGDKPREYSKLLKMEAREIGGLDVDSDTKKSNGSRQKATGKRQAVAVEITEEMSNLITQLQTALKGES